MNSKPYTEQELDILKRYYPQGGWRLAFDMLKANGFTRSRASVANTAIKNGLRAPGNGRFQKGQAPKNKGKKMSREVYQKASKTMFKKGNRPHTTLYDYAVSLRQSKAVKGEFSWYIRMAKSKWIPLNQFVWMNTHGDIPPHHIITMQNPEFENLVRSYFTETPPKQEPPDQWQKVLAFAREAAPLVGLMSKADNAQRNWDYDKATAATKGLSHKYVLGKMTPKDKETRRYIKKHMPQLVELERQRLLNLREIKNRKK